MESIEILKQELLNQKKAIEDKGGTVSILNTNPSPAEITQGIKNLKIPDFTATTAVETDVLNGKTFYSKDGSIKMGTFVDPSEKYEHVFNHMNKVQTSTKTFDYEMPERVTVIRRYMCYENLNYINIYFNDAVEVISAYAFSGTKNFNFYNFANLSNLNSIETYAFNESNPNAINLSEIPQNITNLEARCFYNMVNDGDTINVPPNVSTLSSYAFASSSLKFCENFNLSSTAPITILSSNLVTNLNFKNDLIVPETVTQVGNKFCYNGTFKNVTFLGYLKSFGANCFDADSTIALSDIGLQSVTFTSVTPPNVGTSVFSDQAIENGLKIYVPDEAIDAYKSKFYNYVECIIPMSQKP